MPDQQTVSQRTSEASPSIAGGESVDAGQQIARPSTLGVVGMLAWREWIRFFRQRNRVIGALGQPILFWLLFGTGMHTAFRGGGQDFMTYYLPGTIALILLFTAIFTTISIIEDRREGFLQNVLVAPAPRAAIAMGKMVGGGAIAWTQAMLFVLLTLLIGQVAWTASLLGAVVLMAIASLAITAMGVVFAWPMDSTQGFHAIMNLVLMPLWLLSGAFFPIPALQPNLPVGQVVLHWLMRCNPMSYLVGGLRRMLSDVSQSAEFWVPGLGSSWSVSILFFVVSFAMAWWIVQRPARGDAA
ncbi:MAG: transport permease protein [Pirellulaceae bacterium]|nr:MAG: transport permease protein [Pirellulaceae bacterium]